MSIEKTDFRKLHGKRVCVACSGGADSLCLLHFMCSQADSAGFILSAVHCEHGIRGESSLSDAKFVAEFCRKRGIPLYTFSEDCPARAKREKVSLETAARDFRRDTFRRLIEENKADFIALAHHKGDEAETVLFHLLRGASLTGAGGMREISGAFLRPFLNVTKGEIYAYAEANGLQYRTDDTNFVADASRNALRLEILPALEKIVPGSAENLARFAEIARADDEFLYRLAEKFVTEEKNAAGEIVSVSVGFSAETPLFYRACLIAMKALGLEKDYAYAHLRSLYSLFSTSAGQTGKVICLPRGVRAKRRYSTLVFYAENARFFHEDTSFSAAEQPFCIGIMRLGETEICVTKDENEAKRFLCNAERNAETIGARKILRADLNALSGSVLRYKRPCDVFRKFGGGTKTLKKYLTDIKIPADDRKKLPLFCIGNEAMLIVGTEISEKAKITQTTKAVVYVAARTAVAQTGVTQTAIPSRLPTKKTDE